MTRNDTQESEAQRADIDERIRRFRESQKNKPARAAQSVGEAVRVLTGADDAE